MKEVEPKEEITLERHVWRALGILATFETIKIMASDLSTGHVTDITERLILGLAIPAWYIWGEGTSAMLGAAAGKKVDESEFRDWLHKDINALFSFLRQKH